MSLEEDMSIRKGDFQTSPRVAPDQPRTLSPVQLSSVQKPHHPPEETGRKTIRINIVINYPENLLPKFNFGHHRDRCRRLGDRKHGDRRFFLKFLVGLFYLSFVVCAATAWGIRNHHNIYYMECAILGLSTFSPFLDFFANFAVIYLLKRDRERDPKEPRFGLAALLTLQLNIILTILHTVCLGFALAWRIDRYSWYWGTRSSERAIIGLIMYCMITMLLFKVILALKVFHQLKTSRMTSAEYQPLARDDEEGRIQPGTVVDFSDDEEQNPKHSDERVRLL